MVSHEFQDPPGTLLPPKQRKLYGIPSSLLLGKDVSVYGEGVPIVLGQSQADSVLLLAHTHTHTHTLRLRRRGETRGHVQAVLLETDELKLQGREGCHHCCGSTASHCVSHPGPQRLPLASLKSQRPSLQWLGSQSWVVFDETYVAPQKAGSVWASSEMAIAAPSPVPNPLEQLR